MKKLTIYIWVSLGEMMARAHCNHCLDMRSPGEEDMYSDTDVGL